MKQEPQTKSIVQFTFMVPVEVDKLLGDQASKENLSKGDLFRRMLVLGVEQAFSMTVEHNKLVKLP